MCTGEAGTYIFKKWKKDHKWCNLFIFTRYKVPFIQVYYPLSAVYLEILSEHEKNYKLYKVCHIHLVYLLFFYNYLNLPPLYIKMGLTHNFVKALEKDSQSLQHLTQKLLKLCDSKIKEDVFKNPQIRDVPGDSFSEMKLTN